jgi:hypothetical protein
MILFGKRAVRDAKALELEVNKLKAQNVKKIDKATDSSKRLHDLLKSNGISLRIYVATGGDKRHA